MALIDWGDDYIIFEVNGVEKEYSAGGRMVDDDTGVEYIEFMADNGDELVYVFDGNMIMEGDEFEEYLEDIREYRKDPYLYNGVKRSDFFRAL